MVRSYTCLLDGSYTCLLDATNTCLLDGSYTCLLDGSYTCLLDGSYTCLLDGSYTCLLDGSYTCLLDGSYTCLLDGSYTCLLDGSYTCLLDGSYTCLLDGSYTYKHCNLVMTVELHCISTELTVSVTDVHTQQATTQAMQCQEERKLELFTAVPWLINCHQQGTLRIPLPGTIKGAIPRPPCTWSV